MAKFKLKKLYQVANEIIFEYNINPVEVIDMFNRYSLKPSEEINKNNYSAINNIISDIEELGYKPTNKNLNYTLSSTWITLE